ncbi:hypothetical protein KSS87_014936 [Heliosperma pusillum]|nr:hypothetical protein KSS87_014936 [Heliosperma pusillum]
MQTMGNEAKETHLSHKELQCKQRVMKQGRLIVQTRSYNANKWGMKKGRLIVHTRSYNANNG